MKKSTRLLGAIVVSIIAPSATALAAGTQPQPLAHVAHKLGLQYSYLENEDAVLLTGHGLTVTVRPGSPFFYNGARIEPVDGGMPTFHDNDVYVPVAFVHQLSSMERASDAMLGMTRNAKLPQIATLAAEAKAPPVERHATSVRLATIKGTENLRVFGTATPGALVSIVLKAISSPDIPTVFLGRSFVEANEKGTFETTLPMAPAYFNGSVFVAEASGIDDVDPVTTHFAPPLR